VSDINVYDSLDERTAAKNFLGKSVEEAEQMFKDNSACYLEDLRFMGPVAFSFYLDAAIRYLHSEEAIHDNVMLIGLCQLVDQRLTYGLLPQESFSRIQNVVEYVLDHYDRFKVREAYRNARKKYLKLRRRMREVNG